MKRKKTEFRKQQIIEIAAKLIFKYGSEHLTVKRLATEIGISEAAIYRHFKSKKSILSFLLSYIEETLIADISRERKSGEAVTLDTIEGILPGPRRERRDLGDRAPRDRGGVPDL